MRLRPSLAIAALALAALGPATEAGAVEPSARAAFSRRRIMATEEVRYTITVTADRLPRAIATPQPDFSEFEVLDGPAVSSSQNVSIINGQVSQSMVRTYSWILSPKKEGSLAVPALAVDVGGRQVQAGREVIEVVSGVAALAPPPGGSQQPGRRAPAPPPRARAESSRGWNTPSEPTLELLAQAEDDDVWLGEELTLSHVLRYDVNVATYAPQSAPDFPGFANTPQEIKAPEGRPIRDEATGALLYHQAELARWSLVPLATGAQEIPGLNYVLTLSENPFRVFSPMPGFERQVTARMRPVKIQVRPLPAGAPPSFSGAVGSFRLTGSLDAQEVREGDGVTLTLQVEGRGSFRGVAPPRIVTPEGLKSFDPEVNEHAGLDTTGHTQGSKSFRYPILVTSAGTHEIPAIEWTHFDPGSGRYVTRSAGPFLVTATPGEQPAMGLATRPREQAQMEVGAVASDIRHVEQSLSGWTPDLGQAPPPRWSWALLAAAPALNVLLLLATLVTALRANDPSSRRAKGAGRTARSRLREARSALASGKAAAASDAVARAVAGVVSDRLLLGASLSAAEASSALAAAGAPHLAGEVEGLLRDCDAARFAGSGQAGAADLVRRGEALVSRLVSAPLQSPAREAA